MHTVTSKDGTRIAFERVGQGPVVILVAGAFSYRGFPGLVRLTELLSARFTVVNYDRRGRGDSGDTAPYAVEREIEDLQALIEDAGGSAQVWGLSSGAVLALKAAEKGLGIDRLALYEPPFMVGDKGHRPPADHQEQVSRLIAEDRRSQAVTYFMSKVFGAPRVAVAVMRMLPMWKRLKAVANTLPYDSAIMGDFSLPAEQLAAVTAPTLVISGSKSGPTLNASASALAEVLPHGSHRVLEGQSHNVSMKTLAPVLIDYFEGE
jgi:pimeloyl-ACP methyl ester carboxylesterase